MTVKELKEFLATCEDNETISAAIFNDNAKRHCYYEIKDGFTTISGPKLEIGN